MTHLFLFQIGPVQTFIAAARRTQDLFIGSHLLSQLASAGVLAASEYASFKPIFPLVENRQVKGGAPHRFAFLCDDDPELVAANVQSAIEETWLQDFSEPVFNLVLDAVGDGPWADVFERQATSWMEFYWVAVPYDGKNHSDSFKKARVAMAQRKYARTFHILDEPGYKCTLTGAEAALELNWKKLQRSLHDQDGLILRDNERLGTLALIKRLVAIARQREGKPIPDFENFPSTTHIAKDDPRATEEPIGSKDVAGYLAVLHMDGDQMGTHLSTLGDLRAHQEFSSQLAAFASQKVPAIVENYGGRMGQLVYSGGDDVLALLPSRYALRCANELRQQFHKTTGCNASAGIAITPANLPLDRALELARKAEKSAKKNYGRDAIVVVEAHGTGQVREAGAKWTIIDFIVRLQKLFEERALSGKLGYDLQMLDHYLFDIRDGDKGWDGKPLASVSLYGAREAEIRRLVKRRTVENVTSDQVKAIGELTDEMIKLVENKRVVPTWSDMANWVILTRFLAQGAQRAQGAAQK